MYFIKLFFGGVLLSSLLLANDYYPDNGGGMHCSCELPHFCVQLGVYKDKTNLQKAKILLKSAKFIVLLTEEEVKIKDKIHHRLVAHSDHFFVSREEAQKLLNDIQKKYKGVFPKGFIIKRFIID